MFNSTSREQAGSAGRSLKIGTVTFALTALFMSGCASTHIDVSKPDAIRYGASPEAIQSELSASCTSAELREFTPPQIPGANSHKQIDCQGFEYFGGSRLAEFVFRDEQLVLTWILVEESELDALEAAFTAEFGEPTVKMKTITGYTDDHAAVRYDTPEALYYSPDVAALVERMMQAGAP